jgi:UDP-N-acetyl-D-mannosaminuronic acid transferase (WecB/TagA/CpsF family)
MQHARYFAPIPTSVKSCRTEKAGEVMSDGDRPVELDVANRRAAVFGAGTSTATMNDAVAGIESWTAKRRRNHVCVAGARSANKGRRDLQLRAIHNCAGAVAPNGMTLVFMGPRPRLPAGVKTPYRMRLGGWEWLCRSCRGARPFSRRYARSVHRFITVIWGRRPPLGCMVGSESG